jgi:hypothetical protein
MLVGVDEEGNTLTFAGVKASVAELPNLEGGGEEYEERALEVVE